MIAEAGLSGFELRLWLLLMAGILLIAIFTNRP